MPDSIENHFNQTPDITIYFLLLILLIGNHRGFCNKWSEWVMVYLVKLREDIWTESVFFLIFIFCRLLPCVSNISQTQTFINNPLDKPSKLLVFMFLFYYFDKICSPKDSFLFIKYTTIRYRWKNLKCNFMIYGYPDKTSKTRLTCILEGCHSINHFSRYNGFFNEIAKWFSAFFSSKRFKEGNVSLPYFQKLSYSRWNRIEFNIHHTWHAVFKSSTDTP